ncbi:MAG TPA: trypsin-like peptidase domain-containing protein [Solirubrobacteraceae bacterium]|nr:trypsin-like peptidase domain-containing protein [Solirubrobacteraceae bacterium]
MKTLLRSPLVSATVGGLTVAGAFLALGITGRRDVRTVIQEAPLATQAASDVASGLTPYEIYEHNSRGVVLVRANVVSAVPSPFVLGSEEQGGGMTGSGFVVDRRGDILTNYHLVAGAGAGGISVQFQPGETVAARVMGTQPNADLAVLRVDPRGLHLRPLELGNSATARVGDPTLAIGNPFGLDRTLSAGIVSALQRRIPISSGVAIDHVIETDASVGQGISGGPLIDAAGRVIGVDSHIETGNDPDGVPIGFAVPINTATALLARIGVAPTSAYLGVNGVTINSSLSALGERAHHGVLVESVDPGGPAAKVGLHPGNVKRVVHGQPVYLGGDVIEQVNGSTADSVDDLDQVVASERPGQVIDLTVLRGSAVKTIKVTLARRPSKK